MSEHEDIDDPAINGDFTESPALDPELVELVRGTSHEDMLVEMDGSKGANNGAEQIVREWFSEEDDYRPDTNIAPQQVYALSLLRNIGSMHKELEDLEPFMNDIIDNLELYALSINGYARTQEANVLRAMHGGSAISPEEKDSMLMQMLSDPPGDETE